MDFSRMQKIKVDKKKYTFSIDKKLLEDFQQLTKKLNVSKSIFIEEAIKDFISEYGYKDGK